MQRGHQARWARSVLAGALAAVVLTGCAGVPAPEPTPDPNRFGERGPIMFAAPDDSPGWAAAIAEWNRVNPTQPVTLRALSTNPDQRYTALSDAAKAGRGDYTVMALDQDWVAEFAANDWVSELPADAFGTDALLGSVAAAGTYEGRRYGFGVSADAGVLYYRKDLLDRAGVKAPTTWNQLTAACAAVHARHRRIAASADRGGHRRAPVAALRDEAFIAEPLHQRDPRGGDPLDRPALRRAVRKAVAGERGRDEVEGVARVAAVRGGIGERADHLEELDHRSRPAMGDDQRQRVRFRRADVEEMDARAVDRRAILA